MKQNDYQKALATPFPRSEIEFRVNRSSGKSRKACVLAYITARGIMQRLDDVFGIAGWKDEYDVLQTGVKCRLSLLIDGNWITKEDVAPYTSIEALKGAFSDSLKRTGVKFGIGRYLYDLPEYWVDVLAEKPRESSFPVHYLQSDALSGYWEEPQLPQWAIPKQGSDVSPEFQQKLDDLFQRQLLTASKYQQYQQTLAQPGLTQSQSSLIWEQLILIELWNKIVPENSHLNANQKRDLYRKVINSNSTTIDAVRKEIEDLAHANEEAA